MKVHALADRYEPKMRRAFERGAKRAQGRVPMAALAAAIGRGDVRRAVSIVERADLADALTPASDIFHDAFIRGAVAAAEDLP